VVARSETMTVSESKAFVRVGDSRMQSCVDETTLLLITDAHGPVRTFTELYTRTPPFTTSDFFLQLSNGISHGDVQRRLDLLLVEQGLMLGHQTERRRGNHPNMAIAINSSTGKNLSFCCLALQK